MQRRRLLQGFAGCCSIGGVSPVWSALSSKGPLRVCLVETGHYFRNDFLMRHFVKALVEMRLVKDFFFPVSTQDYDLSRFWTGLSKSGSTRRLHFLSDGLYSCGYKPSLVDRVTQDLRKRIDTRHDIDLILTFGVQATESIVKTLTDVPVIVMDDLPDPVASGIVREDGSLIRDNLHVRLEMNTFSDQIRLFRRFFPFKRLGFACLDSQGKSVDFTAVRTTCDKLGVQFETRIKRFETPDGRSGEPSRSDWFNWFFDETKKMVLEDHVDALYLPYFASNDEQFQRFVDFLCKHRIPTFAGTGDEPVRRGALMGVGNFSIRDAGRFEAKVLARYLDGDLLHRIPMKYFCRNSVVLNLKTASLLRWMPPFDSLLVLENVYTTHAPLGGYHFSSIKKGRR